MAQGLLDAGESLEQPRVGLVVVAESVAEPRESECQLLVRGFGEVGVCMTAPVIFAPERVGERLELVEQPRAIRSCGRGPRVVSFRVHSSLRF